MDMNKQRKILLTCLVVAALIACGMWLSSAYARENHTVGTGVGVICDDIANPSAGACQGTKKEPIKTVPLLETVAMYSTFGLVAIIAILIVNPRIKSSKFVH
jgi:hypothetical protein